MSTIPVKIINHSGHPLPTYATMGSSGLDLRAHLVKPVVLSPMERAIIPTGVHIELPEGYEVQVRPRSGLAAKHGITCLNSPGTIDSDYRGEIKVILINLSDEKQTLQDGERIAQMVLQKVEKISWIESGQLNTTDRDSGGFGHTGKH